jgi:hypothetical protein
MSVGVMKVLRAKMVNQDTGVRLALLPVNTS